MHLLQAIQIGLLSILVFSEFLDFAAFDAKLGGRRNATAIGIIIAEEANWLEMETHELLDQCNSELIFSS